MPSAKTTGGLLAVGALVINAFVWGVSWWPFRQLQGYGLHPLWATALLYVMVFAVLLAAHFESWRGFVRHPVVWLLALAAVAGWTSVETFRLWQATQQVEASQQLQLRTSTHLEAARSRSFRVANNEPVIPGDPQK